jgi:hypothetical protein
MKLLHHPNKTNISLLFKEKFHFDAERRKLVLGIQPLRNLFSGWLAVKRRWSECWLVTLLITFKINRLLILQGFLQGGWESGRKGGCGAPMSKQHDMECCEIKISLNLTNEIYGCMFVGRATSASVTAM